MKGCRIIHISFVDEGEIVDATGKRWRFEVDRYFGAPQVLRRDGQPAAVQPPERSPFWPAFAVWSRARGKR